MSHRLEGPAWLSRWRHSRGVQRPTPVLLCGSLRAEFRCPQSYCYRHGEWSPLVINTAEGHEMAVLEAEHPPQLPSQAWCWLSRPVLAVVPVVLSDHGRRPVAHRRRYPCVGRRHCLPRPTDARRCAGDGQGRESGAETRTRRRRSSMRPGAAVRSRCAPGLRSAAVRVRRRACQDIGCGTLAAVRRSQSALCRRLPGRSFGTSGPSSSLPVSTFPQVRVGWCHSATAAAPRAWNRRLQEMDVTTWLPTAATSFGNGLRFVMRDGRTAQGFVARESAATLGDRAR